MADQPERITERRAAVEAAQARCHALKRAHADLAAELEEMPLSERSKLLRRALANIRVWETKGVASPVYARVWRGILRDPVPGLARVLRSPHADALVQNSPFGFIYREPRYRDYLHGSET